MISLPVVLLIVFGPLAVFSLGVVLGKKHGQRRFSRVSANKGGINHPDKSGQRPPAPAPFYFMARYPGESAEAFEARRKASIQ